MAVNKRLLMVSLDAVSSDDLALLGSLPNFSALQARGTLMTNVSSVLVSNTYPAHTSIITGTHPNRHGLTENTACNPYDRAVKWRFRAREIRVPTLYQKAREQGLSCCAVLYPVTGGARIRYNIPEITGKMNALRRAFLMLTLGSPGFVLSSLLRRRKLYKGMAEPALDELTTQITIDALIRKRPHLTMLHLIDTDAQKHDYGPVSEQAEASIRRMDERLGRLMQALRQAGTYEQTAIVIFSDHGCLPVHTAVEPNDLLRQYGLIRGEGSAAKHDAYFHNAGGTAYLKVCEPAKAEAARACAAKLLEQPCGGRFLSEEEMQISGMAGEFALGIEAADGYCFGEAHLGQHGYGLRREGYYPFYLAVGEGILEGRKGTGGAIIDICPLCARLLGIPGWDMDGKTDWSILYE